MLRALGCSIAFTAASFVCGSDARADEPAPVVPGSPPAAAVTPPAPTSATAPLAAESPAAPGPTSLPAEGHALVWKNEWPKFGLGEVILTSSLLLGTGAIILFGGEGKSNWQGGILFDDAVRDGIRSSSPSARKLSQDVGDGLYYAGLAYPYVVDVVAIALVARRASPVAAQMALMNTEAFAITGFLSFVSNATIRRARPYVRECVAGAPDPGFPGCKPEGQTESFYSGHTGIAFTGAALSCMHHAYLPLYGRSPIGGIATCAGMMAGATATGVLRLVSDKHYASDVIVGAGVGLASGFLVPWLHYRNRGAGSDASANASASSKAPPIEWLPAPMLSPTTAGLGAIGTF